MMMGTSGVKMAAAGLNPKKLVSKFDVSTLNIELEISKRMNWSREMWDKEGEDNLKLKKLINSLRYWHKKLCKAIGEKSLVLTLFNAENEARVTMLKIIDAIIELGEDIELEGVSDFRNPRYLGFHFKTAEMKEKVEKRLRKVGNDLVVYLHWASQPALLNVRVHWFPMGHDIKNIKGIIGEVIDIVEIKREDMTLMSGKNLKRSLLTFSGALREGKSIDTLPHLTYVDGFECLVTAYGRESLCLTCNLLGHRSAACPTPYCNLCHSLHNNKDNCNTAKLNKNTYAHAVKSSADREENSEAAMESNGQPSLDGPPDSVILDKAKIKMKEEEVTYNNRAINKHSWGNQDMSDSESPVSEVEDDQSKCNKNFIREGNTKLFKSGEETVKKMADYFAELQTLKIKNLKETGSDYQIQESYLLSSDNDVTEGMQVDTFNLKRKTSGEGVAAPTVRVGRGNRRTYSKSKNKVVRQKSVESKNLFDVLLDRGKLNK